MKEFITAAEDFASDEEEKFTEFTLDGRVMRSYHLTEGQLVFMMVGLGSARTSDDRFAAIVDLILETLRDDDRDYLTSRLITRDPKRRLPVKKVNEIFEYLSGEWFGRPTESPSDSAGSEQSDGPKSKPRTTKKTS